MNPSRRTRSILEIALLALTASGTAWAAELLVPEEHATIAEALGAASHGDTVSIAPGTYYEHDLVLPPGVSVLGRGSRESVVINAKGAGRVMWGEDLDASNVLENLTLREGSPKSGDGGGGAYLSGTAILRNLLVEGNTTTYGNGAGAYLQHATRVEIEDCVFRNNQAIGSSTRGGGLYIDSPWNGVDPTIRRVDFIGNRSGQGAALWASPSNPILLESVGVFENTGLSALEFWTARFEIENSVVANNEASAVVAFVSGRINSSTIVHCQGGVVSNGIPEFGGAVYLDNSIVAFNVYGGGILCDPSQEAYVFLSCSDVYGNLPLNYDCWDQTGIDGNISADPLFCPESGPQEYPLREDSPCAPGNHPDGYDCGLIGAFPVACGVTATESTSWSRVKRLY